MPAVRPYAASIRRAHQRTVVPGVTGVAINVGDNWNTVTAANPAGTIFIPKTGTHSGANVWDIVPKAGNQYIAEEGCILNGNLGLDHYAFRTNAADISNVVLKNMRITNYDNPWNNRGLNQGQLAAVFPWSNNAHANPGINWRVEDCEIDNNTTGGLGTATGMNVINCYIHHNGESNFVGNGDNIVISGTECSFGNPNSAFSAGFGAGGSKWVFTNGLKIGDVTNRPFIADNGLSYSNWFHHNKGPGIWTDIDNINTEISYNICEDNTYTGAAAPGIFHEISYAAQIHHNLSRRNQRNDDTWAWSAQILSAASRDVQIYDNIVWCTADQDAIIIVQQDRQETPATYGPHLNINNDIFNNDITFTGSAGWMGAFPVFNLAAFLAGGSSMNGNHYHVPESTPGATARFAWDGSLKTWTQLRNEYSQELSGTID